MKYVSLKRNYRFYKCTLKLHGNSTKQKINALSNTHTKCTKETCMAYTLYMIMTTSIHLGSEKKSDRDMQEEEEKTPVLGRIKDLR